MATKPHPDFPLFLHATGQWAKKVRGRLRYFGTDADAALDRWLRDKDDLIAGRTPRAACVTLQTLCNDFLTAKRDAMLAGDLSSRTWSDYYRICGLLIEHFGKEQPIETLRPDDFGRYRSALAETRGPVAIANAIVRTRVVFKWAFDNELIDRPVRFGSVFRRPAKRLMRRAKREAGSRVYSPEDLRKLLAAAGRQMRAMILLGVNCGFGQTDIATLPLAVIDLKAGFIDYPRPKTEIVRRCPLWPETVKALREVVTTRPLPAREADAGLAFLTKSGQRWIREFANEASGKITFCDYLAAEFRKLKAKLRITGRGSFYNLRHTFRTIADASKDQPAIDRIMGHTTGHMAEAYRERIDDGRLRDVVNVVRDWLWPDELMREK